MIQMENPKTIEYFYEKNRFLNLLRDTKKYTDLWKSKNAFLCFLLSIAMTIMFFYMYENAPLDNLLEVVRVILITIAGGFFSLLGLIIGGLALITASIGNDLIDEIKKVNKVEEIMSVIFNFYFSGVITGLTLIGSVIAYIVTFLPMEFKPILFFVWCFIHAYMITFSVIYSVMLLGTCIRIFLLRYFYLNSNKKD